MAVSQKSLGNGANPVMYRLFGPVFRAGEKSISEGPTDVTKLVACGDPRFTEAFVKNPRALEIDADGLGTTYTVGHGDCKASFEAVKAVNAARVKAPVVAHVDVDAVLISRMKGHVPRFISEENPADVDKVTETTAIAHATELGDILRKPVVPRFVGAGKLNDASGGKPPSPKIQTILLPFTLEEYGPTFEAIGKRLVAEPESIKKELKINPALFRPNMTYTTQLSDAEETLGQVKLGVTGLHVEQLLVVARSRAELGIMEESFIPGIGNFAQSRGVNVSVIEAF